VHDKLTASVSYPVWSTSNTFWPQRLFANYCFYVKNTAFEWLVPLLHF